MSFLRTLLIFVFVFSFLNINESDAKVELHYKEIKKIKLDEDFITGSVWSFYDDRGNVTLYYFKKGNTFKNKRLRYYYKNNFYTPKNEKVYGSYDERWSIEDNVLVMSFNNGFANLFKNAFRKRWNDRNFKK